MSFAKMRMCVNGFARTSFLCMYACQVSRCTSSSRQMLTNRSRRLSLEYQNLCMMPSTQNTMPWAFMKSRRAWRSAATLPVASNSATAEAANRPPAIA